MARREGHAAVVIEEGQPPGAASLAEALSITGPVSDLDRFAEALLELDVCAQELRRDPRGEGWLPAELTARLASDRACQREFDEFVALELELFRQCEAAPDVLFTARVMDELPAVATTDSWRRTWILASFHAAAVGVAYLTLWPLMDSMGAHGALDQVYLWLDTGVELASLGVPGR